MRKFLVLILLLLSVIVASCATKYVCADGSTVSRQDLCPVEKQHKETAQEIRDVLDLSIKVNSMSYQYKRVDQPLVRAVKVWVKGKIVKQELIVQTGVLNKNQMDVIIFDTQNKTAEAYCQSRKLCVKTGDAGPVNFDQYYIKTPLDWSKGVSYAEKISEASIVNRDVWQLRADGADLWTDTYFGVPLRVDLGNERHEYQNIVFNSVADSEVQFAELRDDLNN